MSQSGHPPLEIRSVPCWSSAEGLEASRPPSTSRNRGFKVYLLEKNISIGGTMAQLDKTFPTNDCSMCIMSPKLVDAGTAPEHRDPDQCESGEG